MATTLAGVSVSTARAAPAAGATRPVTTPRAAFPLVRFPRRAGSRLAFARAAATGPATPSNISDKVSESIKAAEEACAGDPVSGECVAAWDEVEELSAAASHARDKLKGSDPLENYCKDNPEADECRTYED
ncbi:hypothetical protein Taro_010047 [Colocasia esculenta]|uniref:CP12 domain-containing protein n=1 Tax=Colocasia esculenta TaxID=4460 RepID=A0A843U1Y9_COLES|nr:hypothetical protein [Colocasia esculenta]